MTTHALSKHQDEVHRLKCRIITLEALLREAHGELENYLGDCGGYEAPENVPELKRTIKRIATALRVGTDREVET